MSETTNRNELVKTAVSREKVIIRTSILGIVANVFLAGFKAFIGITANSVAVTSDAVNNLTDALSSIVTIVGTKLAARKPDRKHPMGHGRIEYLSAMIVSAIVLYAGITTVVDSVKKIIHPEDVNYSTITLIILAAAVAVKLVLGAYTKKKGKQVKSGSLTASGQDAFQDAILSASVLLSAGIYLLWGIKLEAYVGAVIGLFIVKAGIEMILEAAGEILGRRADSELTKAIKATITREPEVYGAYDLFISNYGPDTNIASAHVEVDETMTAREIDALTRRVQLAVYQEHGVLLQSLGVYSRNADDSEAGMIRQDVRRRVLDHDYVLQFHGFYIDTEEHHMSFDIIIDFACKDRDGLCETIRNEIQEAYPDYSIFIAPDTDVTD